MIRYLLQIFMALMLLTTSNAAVVFEDNFNSHADWHPSPGTDVQTADSTCTLPTDCTGQVPTGWTVYRTTGWWWPPTYKDTIAVSDLAGRGGSGKSVIVQNESNVGSGDGWGADGILGKVLSQEYPELYVRIWMRTQAGYQWPAAATQQIKVLRIGRYRGTGDPMDLGATPKTHPLVFWDPLHSASGYGTQHIISSRCYPDYSYGCNVPSTWEYMVDGYTTAVPTDAGHFADTEWHRLDYRVKMNTYSGGAWNDDGIIQLWWDGDLRYSYTTEQWNGTGSGESDGWNYVAIGGNAMNQFTAEANKGEEWYAIDDVVVLSAPLSSNDAGYDATQPGNLSDAYVPGDSPPAGNNASLSGPSNAGLSGTGNATIH